MPSPNWMARVGRAVSVRTAEVVAVVEWVARVRVGITFWSFVRSRGALAGESGAGEVVGAVLIAGSP